MMREMPPNVPPYQRTPEFDQESIPAGLLKSHSTKSGVWGKIVVLEGALRYTVLEPEAVISVLDPTLPGIIEPTVKHEIAALGEVKFYVEFYR